MDEKWFLVMCKPQRESDAYIHLRRQGYAVFFPRRWHTWSRNGHTTSELRPFFPGYLFAAMVSEHHSVAGIRETTGVITVRFEAGEAYQVPGDTLWRLRRFFDPDGLEPPGARTAKHIRRVLRHLAKDVREELMAAIERVSDSGVVRTGRRGSRSAKRLVVDQRERSAYKRWQLASSIEASRAVRLAAVSLPGCVGHLTGNPQNSAIVAAADAQN